MLSGTFTVETSTDPRFSVGVSYPLTIDASVELDVITTSTVTATVPPAPTLTIEPALPAGDTSSSTMAGVSSAAPVPPATA